MSKSEEAPGATVRRLLRHAETASLASALARDGSGWPYGSLVLLTLDLDASPVLFLSDLSDHAKNIAEDPRVSLLVDGTRGWRDPLAGPRGCVLGQAEEVASGAHHDGLKARFVRRHPGAEIYADFKDFRLYRIAVTEAHLVAGFGRIHWFEANELLLDGGDLKALSEAESELCSDLNQRLRAALDTLAADAFGGAPGAWHLVGVDPEGCDLRGPEGLQRLQFGHAISDPKDVERALLALAGTAQP